MKATKQQTERRVEELLRIRLDGAEWWAIREYVREKEQVAGSAWHLPPNGTPFSDSQIRRLAAKADKAIGASRERSRKKAVRLHLARRRCLYAKAVLAGDIRSALACLRDEADLLGLYPPKRTKAESSGPVETPVTLEIDDATRADAIRRLFARFDGRYNDQIEAAGPPPATIPAQPSAPR